ncbi:hypothetical protein L1887_03823 [Cichorium endivia]|nr:hypothetical protein L1887_03823 [Cichorium endivia]
MPRQLTTGLIGQMKNQKIKILKWHTSPPHFPVPTVAHLSPHPSRKGHGSPQRLMAKPCSEKLDATTASLHFFSVYNVSFVP